MKTRRSAISIEQFCLIWQSAESIDDVAEAAGSTNVNVRQRAYDCRRAGVLLKPMRAKRGRGRPRIDVDGLNALIERLRVEGLSREPASS